MNGMKLDSDRIRFLIFNSLIDLDGRVDFPHEVAGTDISDRATQNAEAKAKKSHVSKIECSLKESVHSERNKKPVDENLRQKS